MQRMATRALDARRQRKRNVHHGATRQVFEGSKTRSSAQRLDNCDWTTKKGVSNQKRKPTNAERVGRRIQRTRQKRNNVLDARRTVARTRTTHTHNRRAQQNTTMTQDSQWPESAEKLKNALKGTAKKIDITIALPEHTVEAIKHEIELLKKLNAHYPYWSDTPAAYHVREIVLQLHNHNNVDKKLDEQWLHEWLKIIARIAFDSEGKTRFPLLQVFELRCEDHEHPKRIQEAFRTMEHTFETHMIKLRWGLRTVDRSILAIVYQRLHIPYIVHATHDWQEKGVFNAWNYTMALTSSSELESTLNFYPHWKWSKDLRMFLEERHNDSKQAYLHATAGFNRLLSFTFNDGYRVSLDTSNPLHHDTLDYCMDIVQRLMSHSISARGSKDDSDVQIMVEVGTLPRHEHLGLIGKDRQSNLLLRGLQSLTHQHTTPSSKSTLVKGLQALTNNETTKRHRRRRRRRHGRRRERVIAVATQLAHIGAK